MRSAAVSYAKKKERRTRTEEENGINKESQQQYGQELKLSWKKDSKEEKKNKKRKKERKR